VSVKGEGVSDRANQTFFKTSTGIHLCLLHDLVRTTGERKYPNKRKCAHDRSHQDGKACQTLQNTSLCPRFWPQLLQGNVHRLNERRIEENNHCKGQNNKNGKFFFYGTHLAIDLWTQRFADVILRKCVYIINSIRNSTSSYYSEHCNAPSHTTIKVKGYVYCTYFDWGSECIEYRRCKRLSERTRHDSWILTLDCWTVDSPRFNSVTSIPSEYNTQVLQYWTTLMDITRLYSTGTYF
jgi:hypothetical protein